MPRHIDPPKTIAERGLENYLNETAGIHNGAGYADFTHRIRLRVPKSIIAEDFNVSKRTIYHWFKVYNAETTSRALADQA